MAKAQVLDPTDEDFEDPLAGEAYKEMEENKDKTPMDKALGNLEEKPEEKPAEPVKPAEPTPEELAAKEEEKAAEELKKKEEEDVKAEEERVAALSEEEKAEEEKKSVEAKKLKLEELKLPEDASDEDITEKEAEVLKEAEATKKLEEKPEEEVIRELAVSESLTIDEAKEKFEGRKSLLEKYENDPVKMAKALQSTQSAYDKTRVENEDLKKQPDVDNLEQEIVLARAKVPAYVQNNQDKLIEQYRTKYPVKSEKMETPEIIEEITAIVSDNFEAYAQRKVTEVKTQASARRTELINGISETDRKFLPEVKAILNETPDIQVMSKAFDINDLIFHARGKLYTPEYIEQIKQEALKKGEESPKIIGEKVSTPTGAAKIVKSKPTGELNTTQTERAVEMFPDMDLKEAIADYKDLFKDELKEDPKFIG